ncbi:MAG: peptidylprolyl isomerase [Ignavibacteriales bacterium]|nr:peptidylprolyl isomerase [Ignavibacteriales bacterium]
MTIAKNKVVTIDYTLTDEKGTIIDSSKGQEPLSYIQGQGNVIPGLENSLDGKGRGDSVKVSVPPAEAYGEWDEEKIVDLPLDRFEGAGEIKKGMQFRAQGEQGAHIVTVTKVKEKTVTVDANHPLAGKTLNFDVTVVDVREATKEELNHGHVHEPGGDH